MKFFRRTPWERVTTGLIGLGLVMMMQPWSIDVFSYAFTVLLIGVVGYSIAGKLPQ
jgi:CO dehydrogenase/acetyl-CoA synthase delta subunit